MSPLAKILSFDELEAAVARCRDDGKTVVQCNGIFDLVHVGHIRHLESAREQGDILVVTVTADQAVNRGPGRPRFPIGFRLETLAALQFVDFVAENPWPSASDAIRVLKPDVYARGPDYEEELRGGATKDDEVVAIEEVGGRFFVTDDVSFTAASVVSPHVGLVSDETQSYLKAVAVRHPPDAMLEWIDRVRQQRVLVIGETIIDEYCFVEPMGRSSKEPLLAMRQISSESYAGGILAVANNVVRFSDHVDLLSMLGTGGLSPERVRSQVDTKIGVTFFDKPGAATIVKRRYVENYTLAKLFEVYEMERDEPPEDLRRDMEDHLRRHVADYDVVIVADYGHGMITSEMRKILSEKSRFLALNVQSNAGNHPFNTLSRYRRADYATATETELRLDTRSPSGTFRSLLEQMRETLSASTVVMTRGKYGCICFAESDGFIEVPAVATQVVDRVGAGDAFLSASALVAGAGAPTEVIGFIGNVASIQAVATVGHQRSLHRQVLVNDITRLLG
jgi:cytidyltransferase-like protein